MGYQRIILENRPLMVVETLHLHVLLHLSKQKYHNVVEIPQQKYT